MTPGALLWIIVMEGNRMKTDIETHNGESSLFICSERSGLDALFTIVLIALVVFVIVTNFLLVSILSAVCWI